MTEASDAPTMVARPDGLRLACRHRPGQGPLLVFLPGYMSDMDGTKAIALDVWAVARGRAMLRLDYAGCGASEGAFEDGTLDGWADDARLLVDRFATPAGVVLVGSSMGGWIALLLGTALGPTLRGVVGVAAAPDFTHWGFDDAAKATIRDTGQLIEPSAYGDAPLVTTRGFWRSGEANRVLNGPIAIDCPVRLMQGQGDAEVPWRTALAIADRLNSSDVQIHLVKDGDHRLSRPSDIRLLLAVVDALSDEA